MAGALPDNDDEKPLDPAAERVRRKLVRFMAINLGILFLALMAVVAALVYKSMTVPPEAPAVASDLPSAALAARPPRYSRLAPGCAACAPSTARHATTATEASQRTPERMAAFMSSPELKRRRPTPARRQHLVPAARGPLLRAQKAAGLARISAPA